MFRFAKIKKCPWPTIALIRSWQDVRYSSFSLLCFQKIACLASIATEGGGDTHLWLRHIIMRKTDLKTFLLPQISTSISLKQINTKYE